MDKMMSTQNSVRAFCDACRVLFPTSEMVRVEGIWHCAECADDIQRDREAFEAK
jgi:ribosomal protein L37AE/L43A